MMSVQITRYLNIDIVGYQQQLHECCDLINQDSSSLYKKYKKLLDTLYQLSYHGIRAVLYNFQPVQVKMTRESCIFARAPYVFINLSSHLYKLRHTYKALRHQPTSNF
ncbi:hypothetical protein WBP_0374 [Wolbachia endosymbiont of Brugia pahangi]|nr:hypothetical protein WBP_0374 [Wolbachia endosymbiont of Brugia pahangi]